MGLIGKNKKKKKKVSKSRERAEILKNAVHETVEIHSDDGLKLVGHYFPQDNAVRIIIAVHGWRSTWNYDFNGQYQFLADNNCSMLFIESRAHGKSKGRYMYYGKKERFDCRLRLKMDDNEYTALDALKTNKIPLLIINGTKDRIAPPFMAESLYNNCKAPKEKVTFNHAGHMKSYYLNPHKYQEAVLDFLKTYSQK